MSNEITLAIVGGLGGVIASFFLWAGTRGKTKADSKAALDKRIDERINTELARVYARIDELQEELDEGVKREGRRTAAFTRILKQIAAQWNAEHMPSLDPADIAIVEDTIPPHWVRRSPKGS